MSRKFLTPIDLNKNEIQNAVAQVLATAPTTPVTGQFYYDSTAGRFIFRGASAWIDPTARANHTGTQTASTISDFATTVQATRLDQFAAPTAAVSFNSQRITAVATPTASTDAANKQYVDDKVAGLSWKDEVRAATTAAGTLASSFANGSAIDGVTLATGDRILLKNQAAGAENGIYTVNATGAPTRAVDSDTAAKVAGTAVFVAEGTTNAGQRYVLTTGGAITLGTTALTFGLFGGGATYSAGNGLTITGNTFDVGAGTGITVGADTVGIDTAVVVRKFAATIGDGTTTSIAVTHSLGTQDVTAQVREISTNAVVECDIVMTSTTVTTFIFSVAPTASAMRVVIHG